MRKPLCGLSIIAFHRFTLAIIFAHIKLGFGIAYCSGLHKPSKGLLIIATHTPTQVISFAQGAFRIAAGLAHGIAEGLHSGPAVAVRFFGPKTNYAQIVRSQIIPLSSQAFIQVDGFGQTPLHALAPGIQNGQIVHAGRVILLRAQFIPLGRFRVITRNLFAGCVLIAQDILSRGIALQCRPLIPIKGFSHTVRPVAALFIPTGEIDLRQGIAGFGRLMHKAVGIGFTLGRAYPGHPAVFIHSGQPEGGFGAAGLNGFAQLADRSRVFIISHERPGLFIQHISIRALTRSQGGRGLARSATGQGKSQEQHGH